MLTRLRAPPFPPQVLNSPGWASVTGEKLTLDDGEARRCTC